MKSRFDKYETQQHNQFSTLQNIYNAIESIHDINKEFYQSIIPKSSLYTVTIDSWIKTIETQITNYQQQKRKYEMELENYLKQYQQQQIVSSQNQFINNLNLSNENKIKYSKQQIQNSIQQPYFECYYENIISYLLTISENYPKMQLEEKNKLEKYINYHEEPKKIETQLKQKKIIRLRVNYRELMNETERIIEYQSSLNETKRLTIVLSEKLPETIELDDVIVHFDFDWTIYEQRKEYLAQYANETDIKAKMFVHPSGKKLFNKQRNEYEMEMKKEMKQIVKLENNSSQEHYLIERKEYQEKLNQLYESSQHLKIVSYDDYSGKFILNDNKKLSIDFVKQSTGKYSLKTSSSEYQLTIPIEKYFKTESELKEWYESFGNWYERKEHIQCIKLKLSKELHTIDILSHFMPLKTEDNKDILLPIPLIIPSCFKFENIHSFVILNSSHSIFTEYLVIELH